MSKTTNLLIGFAATAAAGLLTGILIAPYKGSKTRRKVMKRTRKMTDDLSKSVHKRLDDIEDHVKQIKNHTEAEIKARAEHLKKTLNERIDKVAHKASAN